MNFRLTSKIIMASLCIHFTAFAQKNEFKDPKSGTTYLTTPTVYNPFPDSIRVEFPDQKSLIVFQFRNVTKNLQAIEDFQRQLKGWLAQIATATANTGMPHRATITVKEKGENEITIEEPAAKLTRIRSDENTITELLPPGWEINVSLKAARIYVYGQSFKDLEVVASQSFEVIRAKIKAEFETHTMIRKSLVSRLILQDQKITYSSMKRRIIADYIELSGNAGFGFLGDKFYPELDLEVDLRFGNRYNRNNHKVSLLYQNLFFAERKAEGGYSNNTNSFLSLSWSKNLNSTFWVSNKEKSSPQWFGLGAGYLILKKGDYFTGKTVKFFISETIGHFTATPEVYLTNDFKNFQMGIRLSYQF